MALVTKALSDFVCGVEDTSCPFAISLFLRFQCHCDPRNRINDPQIPRPLDHAQKSERIVFHVPQPATNGRSRLLLLDSKDDENLDALAPEFMARVLVDGGRDSVRAKHGNFLSLTLSLSLV